MKKILFIYTNNEQSPIPTFPIGLSYVASTLAEKGHTIEVLDLMFSKNCSKDIEQAIQKFSPELIALSIRNIDNLCWEDSTFYLDRIRDEIVKTIRATSDVTIVAGGSAVNIMPQEIKEYLAIDNVITGDGEVSFLSYLEKEEDNCDPTRLEDLSIITRPQISNWTDVKKYAKHGGRYPVQTKRGCAFKCSYCVYPSIEGKSYREISPSQIVDEIEEANKKGIWQFEITDSVFNFPHNHAKNVCEEISKRGLNISLNTSGINPEFFTEDLLRAMEKAGFEEFSFSPDSASELVLNSLGKGFKNKESLIRAANIVKKSSIHTTWWFLLGHPNESKETILETIDFIREHVRETDLAYCTVGVRILPDTELHKIAIEEGQIEEGASILKPVFYTPKDISLPEITEILTEEFETIPHMMISGKVNKFMANLCTKIKIVTKHKKPVWEYAPIIRKKAMERAAKRNKSLVKN